MDYLKDGRREVDIEAKISLAKDFFTKKN